ncbi:MAG: hypothetical protein EXR62_07940 [Chloroflexi bacterium]|nr:hypothetical protein [Chloroflexota bacterium]
MLAGYMGKFLWVDLSTGVMHEEIPDEQLFRDFVGGYGVAARILFDRMPGGVDPLGPQNILSFTTGPLTGSPAQTGTRWTVACKSPLTGGWGDANASGWWGVALKAAGYDAIFFTGAAAKPIYLYIENGKAELRDAAGIWGKDCYEIEDWTKATFGKDAESACIGPSGESLSLISAVIHAKGRAAGRSGVGAVMGSKKLKAIVVKGKQKPSLANPELAKEVKRKYSKQITGGTGFADFYRATGTPGYTATGIRNGDSPTRNWGASVAHAAAPEPVEFDELLKYRVKRGACWQCPVSCWGSSTVEYNGQQIEAHQPEYETAAAFGSMLLNNNLPSLIKANEICNRYGLDTISAGAGVAFAFECFEHGLITKADTGGLDLQWGDHQAIIAMAEKMARREDFGNVIADGVMRAAQKVGPAAEPFAVHAGGQELPMHDPRFEPAMAVIYKMDATPGRHTQACQYIVPAGYKTDMPNFGENRNAQKGRGLYIKEASCLTHTMNASGTCLFGYLSTTVDFVAEYMTAVTGQNFTVDDMLKVGERIANIRQAFNVREGINAVTQPDPKRAYGMPALPDGPTGGFTVDLKMLVAEHLGKMGWTQDAAVPLPETLEALGLSDVSQQIWANRN